MSIEQSIVPCRTTHFLISARMMCFFPTEPSQTNPYLSNVRLNRRLLEHPWSTLGEHCFSSRADQSRSSKTIRRDNSSKVQACPPRPR